MRTAKLHQTLIAEIRRSFTANAVLGGFWLLGGTYELIWGAVGHSWAFGVGIAHAWWAWKAAGRLDAARRDALAAKRALHEVVDMGKLIVHEAGRLLAEEARAAPYRDPQ